MYEEIILQHWQNPLHVEPITPTHSAELENKSCGDTCRFDVEIGDHKILKICQQVHGCVLTTALASMLASAVIGKSVDDLHDVNMLELAGCKIPKSRMNCVDLPLETLRKACAI